MVRGLGRFRSPDGPGRLFGSDGRFVVCFWFRISVRVRDGLQGVKGYIMVRDVLLTHDMAGTGQLTMAGWAW